MNGLPEAKAWPTMESRTRVRARGRKAKLDFYQECNSRSSNVNQIDKQEIAEDEWARVGNGMLI